MAHRGSSAGWPGRNSEGNAGIIFAERCSYFWGPEEHFQVEFGMATSYYEDRHGDSSEIAATVGGASFLRVSFEFNRIQD